MALRTCTKKVGTAAVRTWSAVAKSASAAGTTTSSGVQGNQGVAQAPTRIDAAPTAAIAAIATEPNDTTPAIRPWAATAGGVTA